MKVYLVAVCAFLACCQIECKKPIKLKFIEELLGDSVPLTKCVDHPAYEEEPELFQKCPAGNQACFFVQRDITLTIFGTFCDWSLTAEVGSGAGEHNGNFIEEEEDEKEEEEEDEEEENGENNN